ncbi:MAG: hypothetical protein DMF63_15045 [Acidobacteria bacterium]|nr:MAG: hypothetical protein DMF63_15045 [Acidobacteriota bacterium]
MKKLLLLVVAVIFISSNAIAQTAPKEADPKDVASLDAIMKAVYDVISGDAGKVRDWDRFRSLFHKDARLIPSGKNSQTGILGARVMTPEDYAKNSGPYLEKNGFHEREISRHVDQYGNIAQVFSTYASFHKSDDKDPFMRGINSFQLFNDGKRWWVITIYWQQESPENLIPKEFLKGSK